VPPPYDVPPPTITPEPSMLWFGVVMIIAAILTRNGIRFVLHWTSRTGDCQWKPTTLSH
jgi:hypothetical protein